MMHRATLAALLLPALAAAQQLTGRDRWADSARVVIEPAAIRGDTQQLDNALVLLDRALTAFPDDPLLLHYKGYALYRLATILTGRDKSPRAADVLEEADAVLERSGAKLAMPETFALRSSVLGQRIQASGNPLAGMRFGPASSSQMERAVELGPNNPRVWFLKGVGALYTPAMWGGGVDKAEQFLLKALALFEHDKPVPPNPAWGLGDTYVFLGQAYQKQKKSEAARAAYKKALELQPENGWVRESLLPSLEKGSGRERDEESGERGTAAGVG